VKGGKCVEELATHHKWHPRSVASYVPSVVCCLGASGQHAWQAARRHMTCEHATSYLNKAAFSAVVYQTIPNEMARPIRYDISC
jgi:hypothetical protein